MAKFSLKKAFQQLADFLKPETRDIPTLSDAFAQAAFARQGFTVQERIDFKEFETTSLYYQFPAEATYALKKKEDDGREYVGTVSSGFIGGQDQFYPGRHHNITSIKPK